MNDIKPIETHYAGCRFRSRLEARWAVFFDRLGMGWRYEEEGYDLPSGRYLPDFRLLGGAQGGRQDLWVEVKGRFTAETFRKVAHAAFELPSLADEPLQPKILILGEVPEPGRSWTHARLGTLGEYLIIQQCRFRQPATPGGLWTTQPVNESLAWHVDWIDGLTEAEGSFLGGLTEVTYEPLDAPLSAVDDAYLAARSARFEFGGSG